MKSLLQQRSTDATIAAQLQEKVYANKIDSQRQLR